MVMGQYIDWQVYGHWAFTSAQMPLTSSSTAISRWHGRNGESIKLSA